MKEAIEDLIVLYIQKVNTLNVMLDQTTSETNKTRLTAKRTAYASIIFDLKQLLRDEQDET